MMQEDHLLRELIEYQTLKDGNHDRLILMNKLLQQKPLVFCFYRVLSFHPLLKILTSLLYSLIVVGKIEIKEKKIAIYKLANEKKELCRYLPSQIQKLKPKICISSFFSNLKILFLNYKKFISHIDAKNLKLYSLMRAYESAFYYIYFDSLILQKVSNIFVSSDGSPYTTPLFFLQNKYNFNLNFLTHGAINSTPGKIQAHLAIFYGQAGLDKYLELSSNFTNTLFYPNSLLPIRSVPKKSINILISLGKEESIENYFKHSFFNDPLVQSIHIKEHPHKLAIRVNIKNYNLIQRSYIDEVDIFNCLQNIDLHISGNSNSHLDALSAGVPTVLINSNHGMSNLDFIDLLYSYNANLNFLENLEKLNHHYQDNEFHNSLSYYINSDLSREEFDKKLRLYSS